MSIVLNRSHIDSLSGWDKVKALRAEAKFCESMSEHSPGSLRTDYIYAAHELTKEANLLSTQLSGVNSLKTGTSNSDISIPINPNSQSIFSAILEIFAGFLILVGHILTIVVFVIPYILLADLWDSWILSILVGSIFWIIIAYILASIPWKSLKPTRNWILSPIRALRRLLRRLEESTRP